MGVGSVKGITIPEPYPNIACTCVVGVLFVVVIHSNVVCSNVFVMFGHKNVFGKLGVSTFLVDGIGVELVKQNTVPQYRCGRLASFVVNMRRPCASFVL